MNYFTPTQQRIAMVETASYNQKLLALRARRLAQQRMDFAHNIAMMKQQDNEAQNDEQYLGDRPQITEVSDDEEYELDEIFAPVPYQKGYWLAAQRQKKNHAQKQQSTVKKTNNTNNTLHKPQAMQSSHKPQYRHPHKPYTNTRGPPSHGVYPSHSGLARKKPEYRPATQHHPSYQRNKYNKPGGPPALM